jgi:plastocyanin
MVTTRREVLGLLVAGVGGVGTGCTGQSGQRSPTTRQPEADIVVGPETTLRFDPDRLTVQSGEIVVWYFASDTHNVSAVPDHHPDVVLPTEAEPFASVPVDDPFLTNPQGDTFRHRFTTPGRYVYVCVPHASAGMTGEIQVEA